MTVTKKSPGRGDKREMWSVCIIFNERKFTFSLSVCHKKITFIVLILRGTPELRTLPAIYIDLVHF